MISRLWYFLGSVYLAIILIASTTLLVIAGTLIEAYTESHQQAASFTYQNRWFSLLLWGFFINILVSTLRRWPFKKRHIPFIITHIGLLMILSGTLIKNYYGTQGVMELLEGTGSHTIFIPNTYAILLENRGHQKFQIPLQSHWRFKNIDFKLVELIPHTKESIPEGNSIVMFDRGFGGYAVQTKVVEEPAEQEQLAIVKEDLEKALISQEEVIPPIHLIRHANHHDLASQLVEFLFAWKNQPHTLLRDHEIKLDWSLATAEEKKACYWLTVILNSEKELLVLLEEQRWPFIEPLKEMNGNEQLKLFARQFFSIANLLPAIPASPENNSEMLSAFFLAYDIDKDSLIVPKMQGKERIIELPLTRTYEPQIPLQKLEENHPAVTLSINHELVTLPYDRHALKWPILQGQYCIKFQPEQKLIPHHVRLRQARQLNYTNSMQPYSFECDLLITDRITGQETEATVSMNHVFETWDGYRFYLSNISETPELKTIQLIINHDPVKYWITYPGAIILTLGVLLLFTKKTT